MLRRIGLVLLAAMVLSTLAAAQSCTRDVYRVSEFNNCNNPTAAARLAYIVDSGYSTALLCDSVWELTCR
jgi:hypothetical protein